MTNERQSRPGGTGTAKASFEGDDAIVVDAPEQIEQRRRWAADHLNRAQRPIARYGSAQWLALPDDHPGRFAGLILAAECWAREGDELPQRLSAELEAQRRAHKADEDRQYAAAVAEHRAYWRRANGARTPSSWANQGAPRDLLDLGREAIGGDSDG